MCKHHSTSTAFLEKVVVVLQVNPNRNMLLQMVLLLNWYIFDLLKKFSITLLRRESKSFSKEVSVNLLGQQKFFGAHFFGLFWLTSHAFGLNMFIHGRRGGAV